MYKILAVCLLACLMSSCYTMKAVAPGDSSISIMSEGQASSFKQEVKIWYVLWGIVPMSENSSARVIKENQLSQVRVTTKHTFLDGLIGIFTGLVSIVPATMVIEGNQN